MENGIITSSFGSRISPVSGNREFHTGLDIGVAEGTEVLATNSGVVEETGYSDSYGYYLRLNADNGDSLFYGHLKSFAKNKGDRVVTGDVVAYSGNTGWSTGPHLHYEISRDNTLIDPMKSVEMEYTQEVVKEYEGRGEVIG